MGKAPAFQFYPGDWTRDLDDYPLEIEGAWIRICCRLWWSEIPGCSTKTLKEWARILRKTEKKTKEILQFLIEKHISDGHNLDNQNITIISRRMVEDDRIRKIRQEVGKLGGNPQLKRIKKDLDNQTVNQKPTPSSSSSSSSSNKEKKYIKKSKIPDEEWIKELQKKECYSHLNIQEQLQKCLTWFDGQVSRRRFLFWINNPKYFYQKT